MLHFYLFCIPIVAVLVGGPSVRLIHRLPLSRAREPETHPHQAYASLSSYAVVEKWER
jgi:hypothetical protein